MRTTIELKDEYRAKLLELAAKKGKKGFSDIIASAIELFLKSENETLKAMRSAVSLRGKLSQKDAEELRMESKRLRTSWRLS